MTVNDLKLASLAALMVEHPIMAVYLKRAILLNISDRTHFSKAACSDNDFCYRVHS